MINKSISIYKSCEPQHNNKYMKRPFNSLSSLFYFLPLLYSDNYYEMIILLGLTTSSLCWWALDNNLSHYFDIYFLMLTQIWCLSKILNLYLINILCIPLLFIKDVQVKKKIVTINGIFLFITINNYISRFIYGVGCLCKLSDTFLENRYGTALFHILTSLSIIYLE